MRLFSKGAAALLLATTVLSACQTVSTAGTAPAVKENNSAAFTMSPQQSAFAEELSQRTFKYFWDTTDPATCLAPDRWPSKPFASIAAVGFAITAYGVGAERGYVTREQAADRTLACLRFFHDLPQGPEAAGVAGHRGFFYHFLDMEKGLRHKTTELSTVDTTLFLGGALFAQSYFDRDTATERQISDLAEAIYARVDWTWAQRNNTGTEAKNLKDSHAITMGWRPERGWETHDWVGYNEGMLVYILAAGSPTHPIGTDAWEKGWAANLEKDWSTYYGQEHLTFEPMFGHQYSHVWVDFRGIQDDFMAKKGIDYFENSRRATLSQRAYGIDNPAKWVGYSGDIWGWTASDGPKGSKDAHSVNGTPRSFFTYAARGVSPHIVRDDGTVVPTAPGGSVPFAPEVTIPALMAMKQQYGDRLYTEYGFKDAFNPSFTFTDDPVTTGSVDAKQGWVARDYIGIDQGPILAMMENYRSDLIWKTMRKNPHIRNGLERLGFKGGWLDKGQ